MNPPYCASHTDLKICAVCGGGGIFCTADILLYCFFSTVGKLMEMHGERTGPGSTSVDRGIEPPIQDSV